MSNSTPMATAFRGAGAMGAMRTPVPQPAVAYAICALDDIPSRRARSFSLLRHSADGTEQAWSIFVVRWGKYVFGYNNQCPHHADRLDWEREQFLDPEGTRIMCGKHGARFEIPTGMCVEGPCLGQSLQAVALSVIDNDICVTGVELVTQD